MKKECDKCMICSKNLEMYLQRVQKSRLSLFADRRSFETNIKSMPWK